jgi:hypothetical protein
MIRYEVVFIAGPFNEFTDYEGTVHNITMNILDAMTYSELLWKNGIANICPHLNSGNMFGRVDEANFVKGYKEILRACTKLLLIKNWEYSTGAVGERMEAEKNGIPVYTDVNKLIKVIKEKQCQK